MCHLSVEKLLKAIYVAALGKAPPRTHNLIFLSNAVKIEYPEKHLSTVESLNDLSVVTRYPEDIDGLVKAFTKERVKACLERTKALLRWLKKDQRLRR